MPHPDWEDLSAFFDPEEFATTAVIKRGDEVVVAEVLGIFDDPNIVAMIGEYEHDHQPPTFLCPEVAVAAVHRNDTIEIEGKTFDIMHEPRLDGTGVASLMLQTPTLTYNAGI